MKKKAFTLFSTLLLIFIFSILIIKIFEVKSINSINILNQYRYIQAKNHLLFLEEYLNFLEALETLESIDKIQIENEDFDIFALIKKKKNNYQIELIVEDLDFNIRVYKKIIK